MTPELAINIFSVILASKWIGEIIMHVIQRREKKKDEAEAFHPEECMVTLKNLEDGLCAVLRNQIVDAHRMYTRMGYCPLMEQENIKDMYDAYHALGGNDIATKLKNEILELPESPLSPHH